MNPRYKTYLVKVIRTLLRTGFVFPVKKTQILLSSYEGKMYGCNPRYIFESLIEQYPEYDYIWVLNDHDKLPNQYSKNVKTVKFLSLSHIKALMTSKIIVSNLGIEPFIPKRKCQTFINTWHGGGAYKQVSSNLVMFNDDERYYVKAMRDLRASMTDTFLSSCERFTEVSSKDFAIPRNRFIQSGMPRNDRFIKGNQSDKEVLRKKICNSFKLDENSLLVLYAPTYRGNHWEQANIDSKICCPEVADSFQKRFNRPVSFLFRSHLSKNQSDMMINTGVCIADLTTYPDMQDLLDIADVLITDYSSSIWDFSLTRKPGFLYMPDLKDYLKERGFYTPLEDWPFPYAEDIDGFCKLIEDYSPEKGKAMIDHHHDVLNSYENGNATKFVVDYIKKRLGDDHNPAN